ncbi:uncharacterized protein LOC135464223 [Liolophura sinensis]|uniref:uncharacterized protein LOC135464223 n=1 Tax=Liolophura sinensis TaxID=3198878 RepID=UPI0031582F06
MALSLRPRGEIRDDTKRTKSTTVNRSAATADEAANVKSTRRANTQYTEHVFEVQYSDSLLRLLSYITFSLFVGLFLIQLRFLWNTYMILQYDTPTRAPIIPALPDDLLAHYRHDDWLHFQYLNGQLRVNTTFFVC